MTPNIAAEVIAKRLGRGAVDGKIQATLSRLRAAS
jgi:hypothetical protein